MEANTTGITRLGQYIRYHPTQGKETPNKISTANRARKLVEIKLEWRADGSGMDDDMISKRRFLRHDEGRFFFRCPQNNDNTHPRPYGRHSISHSVFLFSLSSLHSLVLCCCCSAHGEKNCQPISVSGGKKEGGGTGSHQRTPISHSNIQALCALRM